jgi:hypothetical protein
MRRSSRSVLNRLSCWALVEEIKLFGDGSAFVFSVGGIVAAHPDAERLGRDIRETEDDTFGIYLDTLLDSVRTGTSASFVYRSPQSDTALQYYRHLRIPLAQNSALCYVCSCTLLNHRYMWFFYRKA